MSMERGFPVVLSSPSGGGKSTVAHALIERLSYVKRSRSMTTRAMRAGEKAGVDYDFVSREEFDRVRRAGGFIEWAEVHGNEYGTPKSFLEEECNRGNLPLLVIDVQGGLNVRKVCPDALLVFLMPPSIEEVEKRLKNRGTEHENDAKIRLMNAPGEIAVAPEYDYIVVNAELDKAIDQLRDIIETERRKRAHKV